MEYFSLFIDEQVLQVAIPYHKEIRYRAVACCRENIIFHYHF